MAEEQYQRPPAAGLTRFWISWEDYAADWPDPLPPWKVWCSGHGEGGRGEYATVCALLDAADEDAAWAEVARYFPQHEQRFCEIRNDTTHASLAAGGRFA